LALDWSEPAYGAAVMCGYRITETQQIDCHLGFGLNRSAPTYIFGIGYSFRLDGLFR
jgi:hypothetical protein